MRHTDPWPTRPRLVDHACHDCGRDVFCLHDGSRCVFIALHDGRCYQCRQAAEMRYPSGHGVLPAEVAIPT